MIDIVPELGIQIPKRDTYMDLRKRATAACRSATLLMRNGADIHEPTEEEKEIAEMITEGYALDAPAASKKFNNAMVDRLSTPTMLAVGQILETYGRAVEKNAVKIRNMVTNKLILETDNPDARVRLRALELLGKISDVGLFTEKQELTITTQTSDEIRQNLRSKLAKLVSSDGPIEDAEIIEVESAK